MNGKLAQALEHSQVIVLEGDCTETLRVLPPGIVDLTIIDPPYESLERHRAVGSTTRLKHSKGSSNDWFAVFRNTQYWELFALLRQAHHDNTHCYVFCDSETEHVILSGRNPYCAKLDEALAEYRAAHAYCQAPMGLWTAWPTLDWVKTRLRPARKERSASGQLGTVVEEVVEPEALEDGDIKQGMGYHWRRTSERVLFLEKGKRRLNNLGWGATLLGVAGTRKQAPTRKPDEVLRKLILNSSAPGELVFDCFAGSGSTGLAAVAEGRRALLVDLSLKHLELGELRQAAAAAGAHVQVLRHEEWQ